VTAAAAAADEEDNEDDENKNDEDSGDDSDPPAASSKVCSHCNKKFSTPSRLRYHLEKRVCRKGEEPVSTSAAVSSAAEAVDESSTETAAADPPPAKKKKTRGKGKKEKPKTCRGNVNERTCPRCKRVFTSLLGFQYHRGTPFARHQRS
jgi:NMD protein affecting ribosome stability and mRNA decay